MKAIWNGTVIAESDDTDAVFGHYPPMAAEAGQSSAVSQVNAVLAIAEPRKAVSVGTGRGACSSAGIGEIRQQTDETPRMLHFANGTSLDRARFGGV